MVARVLKGSFAVLVMLVVTLVMAGCSVGGDGGDDSDAKKAKSDDPKVQQVERAEKDFEEHPKDVNACRNLALSYTALASPESTGKKGEVPKQPENAEENRKKAAETYEKCAELAPKNVDVKRSLASAYMSIGEYEKAAPLLRDVARAGSDNPNDYYAWGLAASNAGDIDSTVRAWQLFLRHAPKNDPRVEQVQTSLKALREQQAQEKQQKDG